MTSAVTILLVDEEPLLRRATALLLAQRGGNVSAVATMSDAAALARQRVFDVAVVDVAPGGPSPAEILHQLRELDLLPGRLVVCACPPLASSEPPPFTAVIQKPYAFERLLAAVFNHEEHKTCATRAAVLLPIRAARSAAARTQRSRTIALRGFRRAARARPGHA
jgi:DNA-binding NtrC family response regulator